MPPSTSMYGSSSYNRERRPSTYSPSAYVAKKKQSSVEYSDSSKNPNKDIFTNNNQRKYALSKSASKSQVNKEKEEEEAMKKETGHIYGKQDPSALLTCDECKYTTESPIRFKLHFDEPRHVNHFRSMAYREPKKRQLWLKIWFNTLEKAEANNGEDFEFNEEEEDEWMMRNRSGSTTSRRSLKANKRKGFGL